MSRRAPTPPEATTTDVPDPIAVALEVASILEGLDVPYLIGGSLASSIHGEPRSTLDVDIVAALALVHVGPFTHALQAEYYVDQDTARHAIATEQSFNAVHLESAIKVDVFVAGADPFNAERLRTRECVRVGPAPNDTLYVDTAEHSILRKLEWYRRGGEVSDRQWRDVLGIVHVQESRLDQERMAHWARELGVTDLLQRLFDEV